MKSLPNAHQQEIIAVIETFAPFGGVLEMDPITVIAMVGKRYVCDATDMKGIMVYVYDVPR